MLAGVGGIDGLLCVVAADESVMPQTREHLAIATLLRVPRGVIALTKADLVDDELVDLVRLEVEELSVGTPLEGAPIIAVSARTGRGLDDLRHALLALADQRETRDTEAPARLPIDRVFTVKGFGTVVTGTLWTGRLRVDDEVSVLPEGGRWRVRGLQVHGAPAVEASAGQRVAVNLAGADVTDVARGDVLAQDGGLAVTRRLDAQMTMLPNAPPLRHGARVHLHLGTTEVLARVSVLQPPDAGGAVQLMPGRTGWVRLRVDRPIAARRGDRFVARSYSPVTTIAGGIVVDPIPPRRASRVSAAARLDALERLAAPDALESARRLLTHLVDEARAQGVPIDQLPPRLGQSPAAVQRRVDDVVASGDVVRVGDALLSPSVLEAMSVEVLAMVDVHHRADPASDGVPRQSVRERLGRRGAEAAVDVVTSGLLARGALVIADDRLARPAHVEARSRRDEAKGQVMTAAAAAGVEAMTTEALRQASGLGTGDADALIRHLVKDEALLKMAALYVDAGVVAQLVADLRALRQAGTLETVDVGWFKERYGVTRRTAIPLLELLDRLRVTRRVGESRVLLAP